MKAIQIEGQGFYSNVISFDGIREQSAGLRFGQDRSIMAVEQSGHQTVKFVCGIARVDAAGALWFFPFVEHAGTMMVRAHIWDLKLPGWNNRLEIHPDDWAKLPEGYEFVPFSGRDQAVMCWEPEGKEFKEIEIQILPARDE